MSQDQLDRTADSDPELQFRMGMEFLTASRAAIDGHRGIALIEQAAATGHSEATAMSALFEAMGVGRVQNWSLALDRLALAAERGSTRAQRELLLLENNQRDPVVPPAVSEDFWQQTRSQIDIEGLLKLGSTVALSESPRVRVIEQFATPHECRWMLARTGDRLVPAPVFDKSTGAKTHEDARSNSAVEFQVTDMDLIIEVIRARIARATRLPVPLFEPTQILHYQVGQEFLPHHDFLDPANPGYADALRYGQRIATFLLYLNEDYEGGETHFPRGNLRYRGRTGDALFFANVDRQGQPDPMTLHAGLPPGAGEKWILSQWIRDRAGPPR